MGRSTMRPASIAGWPAARPYQRRECYSGCQHGDAASMTTGYAHSWLILGDVSDSGPGAPPAVGATGCRLWRQLIWSRPRVVRSAPSVPSRKPCPMRAMVGRTGRSGQTDEDVGRGRGPGWYTAPIIRTLALLRDLREPNGEPTSTGIGRCRATLGKCLLSSSPPCGGLAGKRRGFRWGRPSFVRRPDP
jgi:hypothetical protein